MVYFSHEWSAASRSAEAGNERDGMQDVENLTREYGGIVIGAQQRDLVLGAHLARADLNIRLVKLRPSYGGGLYTREATRPGFYHNLHLINPVHISGTPWFRDLGVADKVTHIIRRYGFRQAHRGGTAPVARTRLEAVARIARFLRKDAQTFRDWPRTDCAILPHCPSSR